MLHVDMIDTNDKKSVKRFVNIPYRLYKNHPQWVPPIMMDVETQLNRKKHPFYEHSHADFFIATREGRDVGRIAALENTRFNDYHKTKQAQFYLFDCEDDEEASKALFEHVIDWAKSRGLNRIVGPKGFGALDGYGILERGYEHRQIMSMMNYNYPYYVKLVENMGFTKEVDFVSCYLGREAFHLDERIYRIAERVKARHNMNVHYFENKKDLKEWAMRIGKLYNDSFVNNWEYYPLTEREIQFLLDNILQVADPRLIKIITHGDDAVGFLFGFPDLSTGMQRAKGKLLPFGLINILLDMRRTKWIALNGAGVLPEYQGMGGNALLYVEMEKTMKDYQFEHADLTQVAETAVQMRHDLENVGGKAYKNHRVYQLEI
jgi:GNAT superfamily N-acetyltransferase